MYCLTSVNVFRVFDRRCFRCPTVVPAGAKAPSQAIFHLFQANFQLIFCLLLFNIQWKYLLPPLHLDLHACHSKFKVITKLLCTTFSRCMKHPSCRKWVCILMLSGRVHWRADALMDRERIQRSYRMRWRSIIASAGQRTRPLSTRIYTHFLHLGCFVHLMLE